MGVAQTSGGGALPITSIGLDAPWHWLEQGWADLRRAPWTSLSYGATFVAASVVLTAGFWFAGLAAWIPALAGGFLIAGPIFAVGLYETSRRMERGLAAGRDGPLDRGVLLQLAYMGFLLAFLYLVWIRIAMLLYAIFLHGQYYPLTQFAAHLLTSLNGLSLLLVGSAAGAVIALTAFAASAVSIPMILDKRVDFVTAVLTSLAAIRRNPAPMLLWGWLIAVFTAGGIATGFVGLALVFPLIGYATWHAYRAVVPS